MLRWRVRRPSRLLTYWHSADLPQEGPLLPMTGFIWSLFWSVPSCSKNNFILCTKPGPSDIMIYILKRHCEPVGSQVWARVLKRKTGK